MKLDALVFYSNLRPLMKPEVYNPNDKKASQVSNIPINIVKENKDWIAYLLRKFVI